MQRVITPPSPAESLAFTGERFVPGLGGEIEHEHLHRYFIALDLCAGRDVLDVASGEGYGTALLASVARQATGVELDRESVEHARRNYVHPNLTYVEGDCALLPLTDAAFDVVVSFETLEHLEKQAEFLREVRRVLRPGGVLLLSSPVRGVYSPGEANPFHVHELSPGELFALLTPHFRNVVSLRQVPVVGSVIVPDTQDSPPAGTSRAGTVDFFSRQVNGAFRVEDGPGAAPYLLVYASDEPVPTPLVSTLIDRPYIDRTLGGLEDANRRARELADECERRHGLLQASEERLRALTAEANLAKDRLTTALEAKEHEIAGARTELEAGTVALRKAGEAIEGLERELDAYRQALARASKWSLDRPLRAVAELAQRRLKRSASGP